MIKILANDGIDPIGKKMLEDAGFEVDTNNIPQDELPVKLQNYDAITVRSATKVRAALIDACPNLKLIGRGGVGVDNIDVDYAKGIELRGKTLGILGFGRIGREVAKIAIGVGMDVWAYDLFPFNPEVTVVLGGGATVNVKVKTTSQQEIIEQADFITLHTPFVDKAILGATELAQTKKGVGLVNISRGGLIDELALIDALNSGQVSFAALDVFDNEPTPRQEILTHPKISLTPHIGAATNEAQERIGVELASLIIGHFNK